eukprot:5748774-Prymnesium_polylepis.2
MYSCWARASVYPIHALRSHTDRTACSVHARRHEQRRRRVVARTHAARERGACTLMPGACKAVRTASYRQLRVCQSRRPRHFVVPLLCVSRRVLSVRSANCRGVSVHADEVHETVYSST